MKKRVALVQSQSDTSQALSGSQGEAQDEVPSHSASDPGQAVLHDFYSGTAL